MKKQVNIYGDKDNNTKENYKMDSYLNKKVKDITNALNKNGNKVVVIGDGEKIIDQYPKKGYLLSSNDTVILKTNGNYKMPSLIGMSKKEVVEICSMLDLNCTFDGFGYANSQSIKESSSIKKKDELKVVFKELY